MKHNKKEKCSLFVTSNDDEGSSSLRDAINKANSSECDITIIIIKLSKNYNITTSSSFNINSNIKITNKSKHDVTINSSGNDRIFNVYGENVNFFEITSENNKIILCNGYSDENGGTFYIDSPEHHLVLKNVVIKNSSAGLGAGLFTNGTASLISVKIKSCKAISQGSAIWCAKNLIIKKSKITKNMITLAALSSGGTIYVDNGNCVIDNTKIIYNSVAYNVNVGGSAAGILVMDGSLYIQNDSNVDFNSAYNSAGIQEGIGNIYVNDSSISNNKSFNSGTEKNSGGGGITSILGTVYISKSKICNNKTNGMYSGGIVGIAGDVVVYDSIINENTNKGPGGAITMFFGSVIISNSKIHKNTGASLGAAIVNFMFNTGSISITNCEISENTLTNDQTIQQTIESFLNVIIENLYSISQQAELNDGRGGLKFIANTDQIIGDITTINNELSRLMIGEENKIGGTIATLLPCSITINDTIIVNNLVGENTFSDNTPFYSYGGGLFSLNSNIDIENSIIKGNKVLTNGGGIWNNGTLCINNTKFKKNKTIKGDGGGLYNEGEGNAILINTSFELNRAQDGGAINNLGTIELVSCKIKNNAESQISSDKVFIKIDTIIS